MGKQIAIICLKVLAIMTIVLLLIIVVSFYEFLHITATIKGFK